MTPIQMTMRLGWTRYENPTLKGHEIPIRSILKEAKRTIHRLRTGRSEGRKDDTGPVQEKTTAFQASSTFPY